MRNQNAQGSPLSNSVSGFSNTFAAIGAILLIPELVVRFHLELFRYLDRAFPEEIALWGAWGVVILIALCVFFSGSALLQLVLQILLRKLVRIVGL